jgi:hypothetical protein
MKQEILDRLLIDRALEALTPDVAALLDAYLEQEPQQAPAAEEFRTAVRLARLAAPPAPAVPLPPLKLAPMPEARPARLDLWRAWWPAELAAAFVLGIGLTFWAVRHTEPAPTRIESRPRMAALAASEPATPSAFWSLERLASLEPKVAAPRPPRLTWRSIMQNPELVN